MEYTKQNKLETCVERHRADFDLHEPRPELWAALEKQLHGSADELLEPALSVALGLGRALQYCRCAGSIDASCWPRRGVEVG
jgi:hypothetical protein